MCRAYWFPISPLLLLLAVLALLLLLLLLALILVARQQQQQPLAKLRVEDPATCVYLVALVPEPLELLDCSVDLRERISEPESRLPVEREVAPSAACLPEEGGVCVRVCVWGGPRECREREGSA